MKLVELLDAAESKDREADDAILAAIVKNSKAFTVRVLMEWGEGFNEEVTGTFLERAVPYTRYKVSAHPHRFAARSTIRRKSARCSNCWRQR